MKFRSSPHVRITFFLFGFLTLAGPLFTKGAQAPNVIVILADDLGYSDVGFQGSQEIPTPHLDQLAGQGIRFTSGYASHPFCSPMRAGFITGRYQHRFGYERNIAYDPHNKHMGLPKNETTIATRLKKAGYRTGIIGKWHLGAAAPFQPNRRGFDFFYGFLGGGHDYFQVDLERPMGEGYLQPVHDQSKAIHLDGYLTTVLSTQAVGFIERNHEQSFFLFLSYNAPHTPMQAPAALLEKFKSIQNPKRRAYAAMVHTMDQGIGQVLKKLDQLKLRETTLVFFLSDNGGPEAANASNNGPLRGGKGQVTEGGIRVPFLLSWPGTIPQGGTYEHPVISLDITRTALAAAGLGLDPEDSRLDGVNLIPFLTGQKDTPPHEALFWRKENGQAWAVRSGSLKLFVEEPGRPPELYDLESDLGETNNLAPTRPKQVQDLMARYQDWNQRNIPPFFPSFRDYHKIMNNVYQGIAEGRDWDRGLK